MWREPDVEGMAFEGVMTIGSMRGGMRSLQGRVWRQGDSLLVGAEMDVPELDRIELILHVYY